MTGWEWLVVAVAIAAALAHTDPDIGQQAPPRGPCLPPYDTTIRATDHVGDGES